MKRRFILVLTVVSDDESYSEVRPRPDRFFFLILPRHREVQAAVVWNSFRRTVDLINSNIIFKFFIVNQTNALYGKRELNSRKSSFCIKSKCRRVAAARVKDSEPFDFLPCSPSSLSEV